MTLESMVTLTASARRAARTANAAPAAPSHEAFISEVRRIVVDRAERLGRVNPDEAARLRATKLVYGVGSHRGARGVCYYGVWRNAAGQTVDLVEVSAMVQESWVQLAGTTVHELGHVLAEHAAGHSAVWADRVGDLGLGAREFVTRTGETKATKRAAAAGQVYALAMFDPSLAAALSAMVRTMVDGAPAFASALGFGSGGLAGILGGLSLPRPCSAGYGTRGGTSRGPGSGSRFALWACGCERPAKVRAARSSGFDATCNRCNEVFALVD